MRKACANCFYCFYLGDYPNCFCGKNNKNVKATGICDNWEQRTQSVGITLSDAFWKFVENGLARHNENIKKLKSMEDTDHATKE